VTALAAANLEIRHAAADFAHARARRRQARRGIEAIDAVLGAVEEYHLARLPRNVAMFPEWRVRLEGEGGLSIPPRILDLRNTRRLHDALMDWQEEFFNEVVPGRATLGQADEDWEANQRVLPLGRQSGRPGAAAGRPDVWWPGAA
jgi:hypothetical protein